MTTKDGRAPSGQALAVPATPANAVDGPSGFDPSRLFGLEAALFNVLDDKWRALRELDLHPNTQLLVQPAQRLQKLGLVESKLGPKYHLVYRRKVAS